MVDAFLGKAAHDRKGDQRLAGDGGRIQKTVPRDDFGADGTHPGTIVLVKRSERDVQILAQDANFIFGLGDDLAGNGGFVIDGVFVGPERPRGTNYKKHADPKNTGTMNN